MNELDAEIYFGLGNIKDISLLCETVFKYPLDMKEHQNSKGVCITDGKIAISCVVKDNCDKEEYEQTLRHEIIHGVHYILDHIGHCLDYDHGGEILAYYIEYYTRKGNEFLDKISKNGRRKNKKTAMGDI